MTMFLTRIRVGRMLLYLGCIARGGKRELHLAGVQREMREMLRQLMGLPQ